MSSQLDELCINTIRMLSADGVEKANSGHPGLPMGAAAFTYTLWDQYLKFNPKNPTWLNRDRFVLSAGHGSMLLYSLLHLTGYEVSLDDLKQFRQWGSITPGHPEHGLTPGVETTTGPLGQGFANAVGMALAEKWLGQKFNRPGHAIIDYKTYALVSDGDLMEGVSAEAASYAGKLKLGNAIFLYDSNSISIEGSTSLAFLEDTQKRFDAYGWHTVVVKDGNDIEAVSNAIETAQKDERPSLILLTTKIGFGSPNKAGTSGVHGAPLGGEELIATKKNLGWPTEPTFYVPQEVSEHLSRHVAAGENAEKTWNSLLEKYKKDFPNEAAELADFMTGKQHDSWIQNLPVFAPDDGPMATREASGKVMNAVAPDLPFFVGGSADLAPSNNTHLKDFGDVTAAGWDDNPRNLHYGVREHGMGAIANGLALSGLQTFAATFFIFSDYMRGAMRLSAIMKLPVTYILTHDSIGQGEDGTTHQPVEQLASFRAMPGMTVIRPSDATETVEAWKYTLKERSGPNIIALTRQSVAIIDRKKYSAASGLSRGAYIIKDSKNTPDIMLVASGSEVPLALEASEVLEKGGLQVRVVSFPSWEIFELQDESYRQSIFPDDVHVRLIIEAGSPFGWERYMTELSDCITINRFGESAPGKVMMEKFGFNVENIVNKANDLLMDNGNI